MCRSCGKVKRERLDFLADNPLYTKRFAHYVGQRCRQATIKDIAEELKLDWDTVKTLEKQYMQAQLARAGRPGPKAIGVDEISIRKGHSYRIVVSDLIRLRRPFARRVAKRLPHVHHRQANAVALLVSQPVVEPVSYTHLTLPTIYSV